MTEKELIEILKSQGEMISMHIAQIQALEEHYIKTVAPIIGQSEDTIRNVLTTSRERIYEDDNIGK